MSAAARLAATATAPRPAAAVTPDGRFSGYASLFNSVDLGRDRVRPGAFAASLARRGAGSIPMLWQHDPEAPLGTWTTVAEDSRGLFVRGRLDLATPRARDALARMRRGTLDGLSIGFRTRQAVTEPGGTIRDLIEIDLQEISLVTFPLLPGARVIAAPEEGRKAALVPTSLIALRARNAAMTLDLATLRLARAMGEAKYSPDQPRVPAGNSDGGQWTQDTVEAVAAPMRQTGHVALALSRGSAAGGTEAQGDILVAGGFSTEQRNLTVQEFASKYCLGGIRSVLPGQFNQTTIVDVLAAAASGDAAARRCVKLLGQDRFRKPL